MNEEKDEIKDCRDLGLGHLYRQLHEDDESVTYLCEYCGHERIEAKRPLIQPERQHGT